VPPIRLGIDARLANQTRINGVARYATELLRALPAAAPDFEIRYYVDGPVAPHAPFAHLDADVRILRRRRFWAQRSLGPAVRRDTPDVFLSLSLQAPLLSRSPNICTVYDLAYLDFPDDFPFMRRQVSRLEMFLAHRLSSHFITISESAKDELQRHYAVRDANITVAPPGPSSAFQPADAMSVEAMRAALDLERPYILYVGRIQPRKNLARLIAAFTQCAEADESFDYDLAIAGDAGWLESGIYAAAEASPVHDRIRFLGYVDEGHLPALYTAADAVALVSLWEGYGLPAIEALACGTPVLAANTSALPEVVGDAGVSVDPYNVDEIAAGLSQLVTDQALRAKLAENATVQRARYTWADAAERTAAAIRGVAARP